MKLSLDAKSVGHTGIELAESFRGRGVECEFADPDFIVFMITPENTEDELLRLENAIRSVDVRDSIAHEAFDLPMPKIEMTARCAILSRSRKVSIDEAVGRICADPCVSCPPAVPIIVSGEIADENAIRAFEYYGIEKIKVIKK